MSSPRVIVFGATGAIGSVAARFAREKGADVILAVRDLKKPIPGLSSDDESTLGFEKVFADLSNSESVRSAVTSTKATRAFLYLAWGQNDGMEAVVSALQSAGVKEVVFLSSISVPDDKANIPPSNFIGLLHAGVETNLEKYFGPDHFVAVRPGYFASNALGWKSLCHKGKARIPYPQAVWDWISPGDIGRVCGALLVGNFPVGETAIRLEGPQLVSQGDLISKIGRAVGKEPVVESMTFEEAVDYYAEVQHMPRPGAETLVKLLKERAEEAANVAGGETEKNARNIGQYSGSDATTVDAWIEENAAEFRTWDL